LALLELAFALIYCQKIQDAKEREFKESPPATPTLPVVIENGTPPNQLSAVTLEMMDIKNKNNILHLPEKYRRHSYNFPKLGHNGVDTEVEKTPSRKTSHSKSTAHLIKTILTQIYGEVDWRKSPQVRNKIDYVARIIFPTSFAVFVFFYFFILHYR
jgi:hypothetical protein